MRILLVVSQDEEIGGVASAVGNLAKYLRSRGHEVFFFHPAPTLFLRKKATKLGFSGFSLRLQMPLEERHPLITIPVFLALFPVLLFQLIRFIQSRKIQIVNVHYPVNRFVYFALCRRILPIGLVTSVHGADVFPDGKLPNRYSRAFRFLLASSDRIVTPSRRFQKDFLTVFPELNAKTAFIHNGVNIAELDALHNGEPGFIKSPYLLCISAYDGQKAIDVLVRAFSQVQATDPSLKLVLVGAGPHREHLEKLAMSLGVYERIEFLGQQKRPEVATLLRDCKLFVLPSRFETFGIVILEAMAYKKPVVATTAGGIPEIIENGENGILVEPDNPNALAEAIIAVLNDQTLQLNIASNGYLTVHGRFGIENNGSKYEAVFADLLASNERPAS